MSKSILCADDSVTMQTVAEITFRATDFEYVGAKSADEALEKARANKPTLILADAVMPDKDGYELCEALKKDPDLSDVPVMMMCGKSQEYDPQRGTQVGADGHVTKPWDSQVMLDTVDALLKTIDESGVAAPGAAAAEAKPAAAEKPVAPPARPAPSVPASAARSATIMGMPTIKMPPKVPAPPSASITPIKAATPAAPPAPKPAVPRPAPTPAPVPAPAAPKEPPPAAAAKPAVPVKAPPAAAELPKPPAGMPRPPMLRGVPTKRPAVVPRRPVQPVMQAVPASVAAAAQEAGLKPTGPEVQALMKLSREVVERIVWEVVPELAEAIILENLDKLAAKQQ